jgi:prepilin-type N-terminal cleavage/methylation domain-containing protein
MHTLKRHLQRGFTLIELLIVVAVMAVLLLLTLPAFLDIGRGSKMESAVSQLHATINLARQWAITHRETVHIIFPDDWSQVYSGLSTNDYKKALRSYAVYTPSKGYITEWRYLPSGVFFVDTYNSLNLGIRGNNSGINTNISATVNVFSSNNLTNLPFPTATSSRPPINALTIGPDGKLRRAGILTREIYLSEAVSLDGTGGRVVNLIWKDNPSVRGIAVNPYTGMARAIDFAQLGTAN